MLPPLPKLERQSHISQLAERLGSPEVATASFLLPPEHDSTKIVHLADFEAQLGHETIPVHVYRPKGLPEIVLPQRYDTALDAVRQHLRVLADVDKDKSLPAAEYLAKRRQLNEVVVDDPIHHRLLPEELLPALIRLPTLALKRVVLYDRPSPYEAFWRRARKQCGSYVEEASFHLRNPDCAARLQLDQQCLLLFQCGSVGGSGGIARIHQELLRHWALMIYSHSSIEYRELFRTAQSYTPTRFLWATWTSELLQLEDRFQDTVEREPVISLVLARAVADALRSVPHEQQQEYHKDFLERVELIEHLAIPRARSELLNAKTIHQSWARDSARGLGIWDSEFEQKWIEVPTHFVLFVESAADGSLEEFSWDLESRTVKFVDTQKNEFLQSGKNVRNQSKAVNSQDWAIVRSLLHELKVWQWIDSEQKPNPESPRPWQYDMQSWRLSICWGDKEIHAKAHSSIPPGFELLIRALRSLCEGTLRQQIPAFIEKWKLEFAAGERASDP